MGASTIGRYIRVAAVLAGVSAAPPASADDGEAFEKEVRPVLVERCAGCHGAAKQKGGLRVDSRAALLEGGETGPAIEPGHPEKSLLIAAVRRRGELKMPPKGPLSDAQVAALERWVASGAPWPESARVVDRGDEARRRHWAFQPVRPATPPAVRRTEWCRTPIDAFVLARLEAVGLEPSPPADRRTLIRRATFDLTGLPPTAEEVAAFESDPAPDAFARVVDRLLAAPAYGEHWARHWLDVARYSDTKGYVYAREERFFVHAPSYRDWVVRAFNENMPYDRFLLEQVAADQVAPGDRAEWAALGFLTLGRRFLGVTHDIIDDRIDVLTRGTMGLTVACARCHDHKYDPIKQADYYGLYGVFQNSTERMEAIGKLYEAPKAFRDEFEKRLKTFRDDLAKSRAEASTRARSRVADYLMTQRDLRSIPPEGFDVILGKDDLNPAFVRRWTAFLGDAAKADDPVFRPWRRFAALRDDEFSARAPEVTRALRATPLNRHVARAFAAPPATIREVADRYGRLFNGLDRLLEEGGRSACPETLPDPDAVALRDVLRGPRSPCVIPDEGIVSTEGFFDTTTVERLWRLQGDVDRWIVQSPAAPAFAVALVDRAERREPRLFKRGNPTTPGAEVPRRFLPALAGPDPRPFAIGSGRLELARAIVDPANPLTARVWVNRVWMHHVGAGLVRTPSDFGLRAGPPSHPELLDWLARRLIDEGWDTKGLHRLILLSSTYQQASSAPEDRATLARVLRDDPENRLLWRMNPHRLTFEEARDGLLAASGELDRRMGGRASELFPTGGTNVRRTLYGLVDRQFLPGVLRVFDFANPDLHVPARSETTVPQQALFALNHPFVAGRAKALAARCRDDDPAAAVRRMYQVIYQRPPTDSQLAAAVAFLESAPTEPAPAPEKRAWSYGFRAVDPGKGPVAGFHPLPYFDGNAWGGGPRWPDPALGWVRLTAKGGHAGNDLRHAAVRRWTAARAGVASIRSTASHETAAGDGIRCWIATGRRGVLASETIHNGRKDLNVESVEVEAGETIDFVVDLRDNLHSDEFAWAPTIRLAGPGPETSWDAARDFAGPVDPNLSPREQLAQVLLMANEFLFVD